MWLLKVTSSAADVSGGPGQGARNTLMWQRCRKRIWHESLTRWRLPAWLLQAEEAHARVFQHFRVRDSIFATKDPSKWEWRHCRAFRWRRVEHINCLELKAAIHALQWRSRRGCFHSFRTMLLIDNQAILAVMAKGRSSSKKINGLLQRLPALCCAIYLYVLVAGLTLLITQPTGPRAFLMVIGRVTKHAEMSGKNWDVSKTWLSSKVLATSIMSISTDSMNVHLQMGFTSLIAWMLTLQPPNT